MLWITPSYPKHEKNGAPNLGLFGGSVGSSSAVVSRLRLIHQPAVIGSKLVRTVKLSVVWSTSLRRYSERKRKPAWSAPLFVVLSVCLVFLLIRPVTPGSWYFGFCSHVVIFRSHLLLSCPSILVTLCFNYCYYDSWLKNDIPIAHTNGLLLLSAGPNAKDMWRKHTCKQKPATPSNKQHWKEQSNTAAAVLPIRPSNHREWTQFVTNSDLVLVSTSFYTDICFLRFQFYKG